MLRIINKMQKLSLLSLFTCFLLCTTTTFSQTNSHYEKALKAYNLKAYDESYIHLKNALKDNPSDLPAKLLMGEMLLINGYYDAARLEFVESLELGADPNLALKSYGKSLILTQNFDDILLLEFANLNTENKFELNLLRATAHANLADTINAEKSYLLAHQLKPDNVRALNSLVTLYLKQGRTSESQKYLSQSLAIDENFASTWRLKGLLEKQLKQTKQALTSFQRAYELNPEDPFVLRAYADGLWAERQTKEAERIVSKILEQTPNDPYAILLQSQIYSASNKTEEAQQLLGKLAQDLTLLDGQSVASNISLRFASGMTAYLTNNYEQALTDIIYYVNNSDIEINTLGVLADTYLKLNKQRDALKLLEANETLVMKNVNISLLLCDLYLQSNRAFKCETLANDLKQLYPSQPRVDFVKAKTLVARGKTQDAITLLEGIEQKEFQHQKSLAIAHLHFQMNNFDAAQVLAEKLLIDLPKDIDVLNLNVALAIKRGQWQAGQELIDRILAISPNYVPALYNQANLLAAQSQFQPALTIMQNIEKSNGLQANSYLLYADILSALEQDEEAINKLRFASKLDDSSVPLSDKLIELYIENERFKEALWEIDTYAKKTLSDDKYVLTKAELTYKLGKTEEAHEILSEQYKKWQGKPEFLVRLSQTQLRVKDLDSVEVTLLSVLEATNNQYLPALLQLSQLYRTTNRLPQSMRYAEAALKSHPNDPAVLVERAQIYIAQNNDDAAQTLLWKAIKNDQNYLPAYAQLYQLSNRQVGTQQFTQHIEARLTQDSSNHILRNLVADTYLQNSQRIKALGHYRILQTATQYPNMAAVLNNLAFILIEQDLTEALTLVERGLAFDPKSANLVDTKGWITAKQGNYSQALELLRQAYSMNSNDPNIRYHLAYTLHKLGRSEEAKQELNQAFKLDLPFSQETQAKSLLEELNKI